MDKRQQAFWWAALFAVVNLAALGLFIVAPFVGWWLPKGVSTHAAGIDNLFYTILFITGFFFILTEGLLAYFIFCFGEKEGEEGKKANAEIAQRMIAPFKKLIPNESRLELAWTIVPAVILLYIAFVQINVWANIKYESRMPQLEVANMPYPIAVSARQFEWRMRYPSPERWARWQKMAGGSDEEKKLLMAEFREFGRVPQEDDVHVANELHIWTTSGEEEGFPSFLTFLQSRDVQHNFNIPYFRVKQDALPGKTIPVWFSPTESNVTKLTDDQGLITWVDGDGYLPDGKPKDKSKVWEIACAELCGRWHYHMLGRVYVHESQEDFLAWLEQAAVKQNQNNR